MIYKVTDISSVSQEEYDTAYGNLPIGRKEKADRLKQLGDKRRCVFAHKLCTELLKEYLGTEAVLEFTLDGNSKPILKNGDAHFNISHSGDFVACAVDMKPVGIDIEEIRRIDTALAHRVCTEAELAYLDDAESEEEFSRRFLRIWTAKEACLKYTGEGLRGGIDTIEVATRKGIKSRLDTNLRLINEDYEDYVLSIVYEYK